MKTPESMTEYLSLTDEQKMQLLGVSTQPTAPKVCEVRSRDCTLCELERELAAMTAELAEARRQIDVLCAEMADRLGYCPADGAGDFTSCTCDGRKACAVDKQMAECWREWSLAEARKGGG